MSAAVRKLAISLKDIYAPNPHAVVVTIDNVDFSTHSSFALGKTRHLLAAQQSYSTATAAYLEEHRADLQHLATPFVDVPVSDLNAAFEVCLLPNTC